MAQQQAAYEFTTPGGQEFFLEDQNEDESRLSVVSSGIVRGVDGSSNQTDSNGLANAEIAAMFIVAAAACLLGFLYYKNRKAQQQQQKAKALVNAEDDNRNDDDDDMTHDIDDGSDNDLPVEIAGEGCVATGNGGDDVGGMEVVWRRPDQSESA